MHHKGSFDHDEDSDEREHTNSELSANAALGTTEERWEAVAWLCACLQTLQRKWDKLGSKRRMLEGMWLDCQI